MPAMAELKCKCGELLSIAPGAEQVTCPACHATYRVRIAKPSARQPAPQPKTESRPHSKAPLFVAAAGALMTLAACVLFALSIFGKGSSQHSLSQKKNELQQKLTASQT